MYPGPLHVIVSIFFDLLVVCLIVRFIISWLPIGTENPIVRFFVNVTDPFILPIQKRLPRVSVGMFDISTTIAFIFSWWAVGIVSALIQAGLPATW